MIDFTSKRKPSLIGDIIGQMQLKRKINEKKTASTVLTKWRELFGSDMGEAFKKEGDTLMVRVENATLRYELENFRKDEIIQMLSGEEEFSSIRQIRFLAN